MPPKDCASLRYNNSAVESALLLKSMVDRLAGRESCPDVAINFIFSRRVNKTANICYTIRHGYATCNYNTTNMIYYCLSFFLLLKQTHQNTRRTEHTELNRTREVDRLTRVVGEQVDMFQNLIGPKAQHIYVYVCMCVYIYI